MSNYAFIYLLYKRGIIPKEDLFTKLLNTKITPYMKAWFLPELEELSLIKPIILKRGNTFGFNFDRSIENQSQLQVDQFIDSFRPDKIEIYKKMRDQGEPDDELTRALRKDDVDTVQRIISSSEADFKEKCVPFNIFENFVQNGFTKYIDYAAAYGSIKCFKYFLLNHYNIDKSTFAMLFMEAILKSLKLLIKMNQKFLKHRKNFLLENEMIF